MGASHRVSVRVRVDLSWTRDQQRRLTAVTRSAARKAIVTLVGVVNGNPQAHYPPNEFDDTFPVGLEGNSAFFGLNVLRGLVDGIDDFINRRQERWGRWRPIGPAMLGSSMWIDDDDLITKIGELAGACIVKARRRRPRCNAA